jgi:hypothetical protein
MLEDLKLPQAVSAISALQVLSGTRSVEVELPILKTTVVVTPITGSEDLKLRTMRSSGSTFIRNFNTLLFEHSTFKDIKFSGIDDFQNHLTPPDKAMLVYALLASTFSKLPEKVITCPACKQQHTYSFAPSAMLQGDTLTRKWDMEKDFTDYLIESEIVPGFKVFYSMPTEMDRLAILEAKSNSDMRDSVDTDNDVLSAIELFCIYIKRLEIKNGEEVIVLTDKLFDVVPTIKGMPLDLQTTLLDDLSVAPLVEFNPNFYLNIKCSNDDCPKPDFIWSNVNPEQDFFRKALSVYN